jgi:plastocyanin
MKTLLLATAVAVASLGAVPSIAVGQDAPTHTISIMAIEYKMRRLVTETPFPNTLLEHPDLVDAPGYDLIEPGEEVEGEWGVDAYQFVPGTIIVNQGDTVLLRFFGVNGDEHPTTIDGYDQEFTVRRGELTEVQFVASRQGIFQITCHAHPPTMVGHLIVLPAGVAEVATDEGNEPDKAPTQPTAADVEGEAPPAPEAGGGETLEEPEPDEAPTQPVAN